MRQCKFPSDSKNSESHAKKEIKLTYVAPSIKNGAVSSSIFIKIKRSKVTDKRSVASVKSLRHYFLALSSVQFKKLELRQNFD
jgi:hypothetical protein